MSKKFAYVVSRIRVDLGGDIFVDADIPIESLFSGPTRESVVEQLKKFVTERSGEIIEQSGNSITFDTSELTVFGDIEVSE